MADCCCDKPIDTAALEASQRRVLLIVMVINLLSFMMMVTGAYISGSSSLLSGTLDNFGDAMTYAISFLVVGASVTAKAKVAVFKGCLISLAAFGVALHIIFSVTNPGSLLVEAMGIAAILNLMANTLCLWLLTPHKDDDVNMSSVWECSRNDVYEGGAVIAAALMVWLTSSHWPDLVVAIFLLVLFSRSAFRVLTTAIADLRADPSPQT